MDKQEIIQMAREAGCIKEEWLEENVRFLARFATLAYQCGVRDEREACIRACMINISPQAMAEGDWPQEAAEMVKFCIEDIRARNNKDNQE